MNAVVTPMVAGLGTTEILIILGILILLFGAKKLPELARGSGNARMRREHWRAAQPRLTIGGMGRVTPGLPNVIRSTPGKGTISTESGVDSSSLASA